MADDRIETETEVAGGNTDSSNIKGAFRTWVFTLNNYTEADCIMLKQWEDKVTRMTVSKELGEETGTPHLQGAVTFKTTKRLTSLKKLHTKIRWAVAIAADCFIYPVKEWSEVIIDVNNKVQGRRSDWLEVKNMIKDGKTYADIAEAHPHIAGPCKRGLDMLASCLDDMRPVKRPEKRFMSERRVVWIWGPAGAGKSRYVYDKHGFKDVWASGRDLTWFPLYKGEKIALIEEFRAECCEFSWFLRILDKYPLTVSDKFTWHDWVPEIIYVTSPYCWDKVYDQVHLSATDNLNQLKRRIDEVIHLGNEQSHLSSLTF